MCGIAGYIVTHIDDKVRTATSILALEMEDRGRDAWGMFYGTPGESLAVHKVAYSVRVSFEFPETLPLAMAIHTRHGTTGKNKQSNAHPFTIGNVVGMHNGIIGNHAELGKLYKRKYSVDSEHIFANIAEGWGLKDLEGYGTIVYTLNGKWMIGRFQGGELSIVTTSYGVFFASTQESLRLALRMAGIPIIKWLTTLDGVAYELTSKGIKSSGYALDVSSDLFCGKWDDGFNGDPKSLDATQDIDFDDEELIEFDSEGGDECEVCTSRIEVGAKVLFVDDVVMCATCYVKGKG